MWLLLWLKCVLDSLTGLHDQNLTVPCNCFRITAAATNEYGNWETESMAKCFGQRT